MTLSTRISLFLLTFLLAVVLVFVLLLAVSPMMLEGVVLWVSQFPDNTSARLVAIVVTGVGLLLCLAALILIAVSGRLRRARVRQGEIGEIDIGVGAIESIALNAARASQSGVKLAKAHIGSYKGTKLFVRLVVMTYSDVELPVMMARVQERVKKDIEKYTGIEVADVSIRVKRVEAVATRVER